MILQNNDYIYTHQYRGQNPGWRPVDGPENEVSIHKQNNIVYAHTTLVNEVLLNPPKEPFVLVTESGDLGLLQDEAGKLFVGNRYIRICEVANLPNNLIKWFAQHADVIHPKIQCLPLGVCESGIEKIKEILRDEPPTKRLFGYANFRIDSNPQDRLKAYSVAHTSNQTSQFTIFCEPHLSNRDSKDPSFDYEMDFLTKVLRSAYVLCPEGAGVDTYRFWESLYLSAIPVIKKNKWITHFNLPVVVLDSWDDLTPKNLVDKFTEKCIQGWDLNQLTKSYWINQILEHSQKL